MAEEKSSGGAAKEETPTYSTDRLVAESQGFLGVPSHVAAGALADMRKKNVTLDEAKKAVKSFEDREVEHDNQILWGKEAEEAAEGGDA